MSLNKTICIDIKFLAGCSLEEALFEAKDKANNWEVAYVCFGFNGVKFSIGSGADIKKALKQYSEGQKIIVEA